MIQIRIAEVGDQIQGAYRSRAQQSLKHSVRGKGPVEANYLFHKTIYEIMGALQALSVIPCDVDIRIEVAGATVRPNGSVLIYVPAFNDLITSIFGEIMVRAREAVFIGPESCGEITFLQTWDHQS